MIKFIQLYSTILTDDGILIIEDISDINWIETLKIITPKNLREFIEVYDRRHIKNRPDDIVFVINKKSETKKTNDFEIVISNKILDEFELKNSEYLVYNDYYFNPSGTHEYRLYSYLTTFFNNITILDIGTAHGRSAIALSHNETNKVISYNVIDEINNNNHKIYTKSNVEFRVKNVLDDLTPELLSNCKIVMIDIDHYETIEKEIINRLNECNFSGILLLDDIHHTRKDMFEAMQRLWKWVNFPKFDVTKYAHCSGTGLVLMNSDKIHLTFKS
jgi:hypothetical protein